MDADMKNKTEHDIVLACELWFSLILDFNTISFLEIHTISLSSHTDSEILPQISSAQPFSSGMCFEIACFASFPKRRCTKVAATGPHPWLALLKPCWIENELHSTWLDLDEKRSFLERFKYHVPAFGLKEDARTSNTSFESYALDLSQGILR